MGDKNFETGYQHGQDDAAIGDGKSTFVRPIKRLLKPDSFLPGGGNRIDSYLTGYSTGYEDNIRVIETESVNPNAQGATMASTNTLEHQLELLNELHNYLKNVQDQMDAIRGEYGRRVSELRDAGMIVNHHEFLQRNVFNPTESTLLKFIEHLQIRDITTVRKEIGRTESEIDRLRQHDE